MRALTVKVAGLALYIHDLQPGTLTLVHERPDKEPKIHVLDDEDFEDGADEIDTAAIQNWSPVLKQALISYEGRHGGVVEWELQGLNKRRMMASAFTQTMPGTSILGEVVEIMPPRLRASTIQTVATDPTPNRIVQSSSFGFSTISTAETHPIENPIKRKEQSLPLKAATTMNHVLKRKAAGDIPRSITDKLARSQHNSSPWPNHLYMACCRIRPVYKGDVGVLHIDLTEGTVWLEGWSGKAHISQQTYIKKQVDLRNPSTSVGYFYYGGMPGKDFSTHQLRLSKIGTNQARVTFFSTDCSASGYQAWGSDVYNSIDPIPHYSALDWNQARGETRTITIPNLPREMTRRYSSPIIIIDALVHCIDRAAQRQAVHDPITERKLLGDLERGFRNQKDGCLSQDGMLEWVTVIQEVKKEAALKVLKVVEGVQKMKVFEKKTKVTGEAKGKGYLKRKLDYVEEEKEDKKAKVEDCAASEATGDTAVGRTLEG